MNRNKFWLTFVVIYVGLIVTNMIIHVTILGSTYNSEEVSRLMRSTEEMNSMMWMMWLIDLVWAFFFTFFFVKGYEGKGLIEGIRFGIYMGLFVSLVNAYGDYIIHPIDYWLAFQWFIYGMLQMIVLGLIASLVYKPKASSA